MPQDCLSRRAAERLLGTTANATLRSPADEFGLQVSARLPLGSRGDCRRGLLVAAGLVRCSLAGQGTRPGSGQWDGLAHRRPRGPSDFVPALSLSASRVRSLRYPPPRQ
jgi:hypothetical protein